MPPDDDNRQVDKLYFRIGEVARRLGVEPSVIRFWESEYPGLRPRRSKTGQRVYNQKDLKRFEEIKRLRYEQGYTTRGTLQALRRQGVVGREPTDPVVVDNNNLRQTLLDLRTRLVELLDELDREGSAK